MTNYEKANFISTSINDGYDVDVYRKNDSTLIRLVAATLRKDKVVGFYFDRIEKKLSYFDVSDCDFERNKKEVFKANVEPIKRDDLFTTDATF